MLRKLFSLVLPVALAAVVLLGACPECQPREMTDHSCCDPASQTAPAKQCPDRNEILRHYDNPPSAAAPVLFVALAMLPQPIEVAPVRAVAMATGDLPRIDGPPDLFLRNAAILI
jgi:hypothetical protein